MSFVWWAERLGGAPLWMTHAIQILTFAAVITVFARWQLGVMADICVRARVLYRETVGNRRRKQILVPFERRSRLRLVESGDLTPSRSA
jgi:hypothetical protein